MDGNKDGDVCVSTVSESSVSVGGKDEIPTQDVVTEGLRQKEKVDDGGGGDCNGGEDIMVEVLGSEVFVDGVCSGSGKGRSSGDAGKEGLDKVVPEMGSGGKSVKGGAPSSKGTDREVEGGKENVLDCGQREPLERGEAAGDESEMGDGGKSVGGCESDVEGVGCEKEGSREDLLEDGHEKAVERGEVAIAGGANSVASGEGERLENGAEVGVDGPSSPLSKGGAPSSKGVDGEVEGGKENVLDCGQRESLERGEVAGGESAMGDGRKSVGGCEPDVEGVGCEKEGSTEDLMEDGREKAVERGEVAIGGGANSVASGEGERLENEAEVGVDGSRVGAMLSESRTELMDGDEVAVGDCAAYTSPEEGGNSKHEAEVRVIESHLETLSVMLESKIDEGQPVEVKVSPAAGVSEGESVKEIAEMDTTEGLVVGEGAENSGFMDDLGIKNLKSKSEGLSEIFVEKGEVAVAVAGGAITTALEAGGSSQHEAESRVSESHMETALVVLGSKIEEDHPHDVMERGDVSEGECANQTAPEEGASLENEARFGVTEPHLEATVVNLESKAEEGQPVEVRVSPVGQGGVSERKLIEEITEMDTAEGSVVGEGMYDSNLMDALATESLKFNPEGSSEMIVDQGGPIVDHGEDGVKENDQRDGVPEEEVTDSEVLHSSMMLESSVVSIEVIKNPEGSSHVDEASQEGTASLGGERLSVAETAAGEVIVAKKEEPPMLGNVIMHNDGYEGNTCSSAEEHQAAIKTESRVTDNHDNLPTVLAIEKLKFNPEGLSQMIVDQGGPIVDHNEDGVKENDQRCGVSGKEVTSREELHTSMPLENSVVSMEVNKNPEDSLHINDASQEVTVSLGGERLSVAETGTVIETPVNLADTKADSLVEQALETAGQVIVAEKEEIPCSRTANMQNDDSEENTAEEHLAAIETENRVTEDHDKVPTDLSSLCPSIHEALPSENDKVPTDLSSLCPSIHEALPSENDAIVSSNAVQDQQLIVDERLDSNIGWNHAQVNSKIGQVMEIDPDVTNIEEDNIDGNNEPANEEQLKDESASRKTDNGAVLTPSCQSGLDITGGRDAGQVDLAVLDQNVEAFNLANDGGVIKDHDKIPTDSKSLCLPTHEVLPGESYAVVSSDAVQNQQLMPDECLNDGRGRDCAQVDSNTRQDMEIDREVTDIDKGSGRCHNHWEVDSTGQHVEMIHEDVNAEKDTMDGEKGKAGEGHVIDGSASGKNGNAAVSASCQGNLEITGDGNVEHVCDAANINRDLSCTMNDKTVASIVVSDNDQNSLANDQGGKTLDGNKEVVRHVDAVVMARKIEDANEKQVKDELAGGQTDDGAVSTPLCLGKSEITGDGNAEVVGEAVSVQNVEGSNLANKDDSPSCIENDMTLAPVAVCDNIKDPVADDQGDKAVDDNKAVMEHNADAMGVDVANSDENTGIDIAQDGSSNLEKQVEEQAPDPDVDMVSSHEADEMETEDQSTDTEVRRSARQVALRKGSLPNVTYVLPPEKEGDFSVSDLVWGKIRSHPWWPGQIFDPSDASEKANKYCKKDYLLVAYFGDRTFAWNDVSQLKPFYSYFSQEEKQSNSESFNNAVSCALEEVGRRVELGLACSCIPKDDYERIKFQIVENAGIRKESSKREHVDESADAKCFEPLKLVEYMKALAQFPKGISSRLEFVIAKAQLSGFYRGKGYQLPKFQFLVGSLEGDEELTHIEDKKHVHAAKDPNTPICDVGEGTSSGQENLKTQKRSSLKRKHNLKEGVYSRKKVRSVMDLMGEATELVEDDTDLDSKDSSKIVSPSSRKKMKSFDSFAEDPESVDRRKSISVAKVITTTPVPKPSFKIGERLRKVASQMTGSHASESNGEKPDSNEKAAADGPVNSLQSSEDTERNRMAFDAEYSSLDDLLSQLLLAAQDPKTKYSFLNVIVCFFSDFRNYVVPGVDSAPERNGKRKRHGGGPETFEFDDMNDSYWTDRVIENGPEEQLSDGGTVVGNQLVPVNSGTVVENQLVPVNSEKPRKVGRRPYSRKRHSNSTQEFSEEKPVECIDENAPAELVMVFPQLSPIPPEIILNRMFKRFGPLKESETEIDREGSRARVVFKKSSDAQVAYSSAGKFNIFGSVLVNYQLNHTISMPFRSSPVFMIEGKEDASNFICGGHEITMDYIAEGHEVPMDGMTEGQGGPMNVINEDHEVTMGVMREGHEEVPLDAEIG